MGIVKDREGCVAQSLVEFGGGSEARLPTTTAGRHLLMVQKTGGSELIHRGHNRVVGIGRRPVAVSSSCIELVPPGIRNPPIRVRPADYECFREKLCPTKHRRPGAQWRQVEGFERIRRDRSPMTAQWMVAVSVDNHMIYNNNLIKADSLGGNQNFILSPSSGSDLGYRYYA